MKFFYLWGCKLQSSHLSWTLTAWQLPGLWGLSLNNLWSLSWETPTHPGNTKGVSQSQAEPLLKVELKKEDICTYKIIFLSFLGICFWFEVSQRLRWKQSCEDEIASLIVTLKTLWSQFYYLKTFKVKPGSTPELIWLSWFDSMFWNLMGIPLSNFTIKSHYNPLPANVSDYFI